MAIQTRSIRGRYIFERSSPLRRPDWRMRLAARLPTTVTQLQQVLADPWLHDLVSYRRLAQTGPSGQADADQRYPDLARALAWQADAGWCAILATLVLGRVPPSEIAARLGVTERVLATAEALFFDVRDRLSSSAWINMVVIAPWSAAGQPELAAQLMMAYSGGPVVARALVDAKVHLPSAEAERLTDRTVLLHCKVRAALEFPLDSPRENKRCKLILGLESASRRLERDRRKFAERWEQDLRRQELPRQRLAALEPQQQR